MRLVSGERAWEDYLHWQGSEPKLFARLNGLIKECARISPGPASRNRCVVRFQAGGRAASLRSIATFIRFRATIS